MRLIMKFIAFKYYYKDCLHSFTKQSMLICYIHFFIFIRLFIYILLLNMLNIFLVIKFVFG
jgi:hypothetical protein